jgi:hypothetical protein
LRWRWFAHFAIINAAIVQPAATAESVEDHIAVVEKRSYLVRSRRTDSSQNKVDPCGHRQRPVARYQKKSIVGRPDLFMMHCHRYTANWRPVPGKMRTFVEGLLHYFFPQ